MRPLLSEATIEPTRRATVPDETGADRDINIAGEYPLTLYLDKQEIVTLMTLGQMPENLALGWLRNQGLLQSPDEVEEVRVDWEVNAVAVYTRKGDFSLADYEHERRVVTSGCGQGSMFHRVLDDVKGVAFSRGSLFGAAALYDLLEHLRRRDTVYKAAGAVHGCALAEQDGTRARPLVFVEDIGRHNAIDAIAGWMWLNDVDGDGKVFYTTGRLTSEMVIKCAQMRVPYLVSRSGVTRMGYEFAHTVGLTMLGRAINRRYLLFSGADYFIGNGDAPVSS